MYALTQDWVGLNNRPTRKIEIINPITGESLTVTALWDTGANISSIDQSVVERLNLTVFDTVPSKSTNAKVNNRNRYEIKMILKEGFYFENVRAVGLDDIDDDCQAIIGMDVIELGDISITNYNGNTCLSFRAPSQHRIDYENNP